MGDKTLGVCPECLRRIPAERVKEGHATYLEKNCPEHGFFRTLIWEGPPDYDDWGEGEAAPLTLRFGDCPDSCGLCRAPSPAELLRPAGGDGAVQPRLPALLRLRGGDVPPDPLWRRLRAGTIC
jgi:hypothetical protein